jgi:hypothetical protein
MYLAPLRMECTLDDNKVFDFSSNNFKFALYPKNLFLDIKPFMSFHLIA